MDLSVCIPTYKRAAFLPWAVTLSANLLRRHADIRFEIVVSDNHSPDADAEFWNDLAGRIEEVRVVRPPEHLPTAEENLRFALPHCGGRYVWVLGDDDDPLEAGVEALVRYVRQDQFSMVVFNSQSHSHEGFRIRYSRIACNSAEWRGELTEFVRRTGFWFVLAGFSSLLLKRPQDRLQYFDAAIETSKIYSHVCWLVCAYSRESFAFANTPLISYRQNFTDVSPNNHWQTVAARENTFFKGLWTNGFLRLVDLMIESGAIDRSFPATVVDRHVGERFIFCFEILRHFLEQLTLEHIQSDDLFDDGEFAYYCGWAEHLFPASMSILSMLDRARNEHQVYGLVSATVIERLWALLCDRWAPFWSYHFFVRQEGCYELFQQGDLYWAIRQDRIGLVAPALDAFDPQTIGSDLLVAPDMASLAQAVGSASLEIADDGEHAAFSRPATLGTARESFSAMVARMGALVDECDTDGGGRTYRIVPPGGVRLIPLPPEQALSPTSAPAVRSAASLQADALALATRAEADRADAEAARAVALEGELESLRRVHAAVIGSTSWKITRPVRRLLSLGRA